ncbi:MAG: hypothetical protein ACI9XC_001340 [Gammaproteobacteria bacterium]|jgi:hypothetical protein
MKVSKNIVIALILAAPLNLVSANELVIVTNTHVMGKGENNHSQVTKDVLNSERMTFEDVVVIAPRLEASFILENHKAKYQLNRKNDDLTGSTDVAFIDRE